MADLANLHYSSCISNASEFFANDPKYREILNLLKTIDYDKLSLDRLQDIRNSLTLLPTCDTLRYREFDKGRDKAVKDGMRVGKFIIPSDTDYHEKLQGKDKPNIYRDLTSDKQYLYDPYSKTLTGLEYPMTHETQLNKKLQDDGFSTPAPSEEKTIEQKLIDMNFNNIIPSESNNEENVKPINNVNSLPPDVSEEIVKVISNNI